MASTHLALNYHVVFSTKDREPRIDTGWRDRFHAFLGGSARSLDVVPMAVGGVADHVHLLLGLRATHTLAAVMRDIKVASSRWIHEEIGVKGFAWQEGYGAFTVSPSHIQPVRGYIAKQEEHHRVRSFQEEYVILLEKCGVVYDPKHLW
jgi:putative transposase